MIVSFKFFDNQKWSLYATMISLINLIIFYIGFYLIGVPSFYSLNTLVFISLLAMISGKLLPKLIFVFFLCMICWNEHEFLMGTILALICIIISHYIPRNNIIMNYIENNIIIKNIIILSIVIWFIIIIQLIISKNYYVKN